MAERGMFATSDLVPLLAERGVVLSREQVYRLVAKVPERVSLTVLAALCDALGVSPSELVEPVRAEQRRRRPSQRRPGPRCRTSVPAGPGWPDSESRGAGRWRDLVSHRVAEAGAGLSAVQVSSAIDAAAPNAKALSVLAGALEPGPGALLVGAPPVIGKLVAELQAEGQAYPGRSAPAVGAPTPSSRLLMWAGSAAHAATAIPLPLVHAAGSSNRWLTAGGSVEPLSARVRAPAQAALLALWTGAEEWPLMPRRPR